MSVCHDHIYVITAGDLVKIGSAIDPHKRRKDLQTGNGSLLVLEMYIGTSMRGIMRQIEENVIHAALKRWRTRGDWFSCSLHVAVGCVLDATQCIADRKVFHGTPRAKRNIESCLETIHGTDEWSSGYEWSGTTPPWPRRSFWWFDKPDAGGVFGFTWMDREIKRTNVLTKKAKVTK
jgi:hypothetical protein